MRFPLLTKVLAIGLVMLLLVAVQARIDSLVNERRLREHQAAASVEQSLAGPQTLLGPLLHRRCVEEWDTLVGEGKEARRGTARREILLAATPTQLQVQGDVRIEARYRGLFKVNGWAGPLTLDARWADLQALQARAEHVGGRLDCGPVRLMLAVSDVRGLRAAQLQLDGETAPVLPGTGHGRFARGLHAVLSPARVAAAQQPLAARITLDLMGTAQLSLVPAAGETTWSLKSDWPHPSFAGRFLPTTREVTASGFQARWSVSSLASSAATDLVRNGELCTAYGGGAFDADGVEIPSMRPAAKDNTCLDTLGVAFFDPINPYVLTDRATKYALLFVVLTFLAVGLTEVMARRPVHPVQYTLVGLALALFHLLLLSLSEHLTFGLAYAVASGGCVALLGFYGRHMLGGWRAGVAFGGGMSVLYGALWALLQMAQTALVIGSLLLFGALAAVMVLTRRVNWYTLFDSLRRGHTPA